MSNEIDEVLSSTWHQENTSKFIERGCSNVFIEPHETHNWRGLNGSDYFCNGNWIKARHTVDMKDGDELPMPKIAGKDEIKGEPELATIIEIKKPSFKICTCGSYWWDAVVVFEDDRVTSYRIPVHCHECGRTP
jgi:hypothetical protein